MGFDTRHQARPGNTWGESDIDSGNMERQLVEREVQLARQEAGVEVLETTH